MYEVWSDYDGCRVDNIPRFRGSYSECLEFMRKNNPPRGYDSNWNLVNSVTRRAVSYVL